MPGSSCATTIKRPFVVPCMGGAVAPGGRGPARFYGRRAVAASKVRGEDGDAGAAPSPAGSGRGGGAGGDLLRRVGRRRRPRADVRRVGAVRSRLRGLPVPPPALGPPLADERPASLQVAVADRAVKVDDRLLDVLVEFE